MRRSARAGGQDRAALLAVIMEVDVTSTGRSLICGARTSMAPALGRFCWILFDRVGEPDLDRGDVDGAIADELTFVGTHGDRAERLELVVCALDGVALLVCSRSTPVATHRASPWRREPCAGRSSPWSSPRSGPSQRMHVGVSEARSQRVLALPGTGHPGQWSARGSAGR